MPLSRNDLKSCTYALHVFTSDVRGAGTDANVYVIIYGANGDTGERQLTVGSRRATWVVAGAQDSSTHSNKFERAQEDVFTIDAVHLGRIERMKVWHDNSGLGAAWHLHRVELVCADEKYTTDLERARTHHTCRLVFPCEKWLSAKDGDGQISRDLMPLTKRQLSRSDTTSSLKDEFALEQRGE